METVFAQDQEPEIKAFEFHGKEFVAYKSLMFKKSTRENFEVIFKTVHPYGVLFHARGDRNTFITFELVDGRVR